MMDQRDLLSTLMMLQGSSNQFIQLDYFQIRVYLSEVSIMAFKIVPMQYLFLVDVFVLWKKHHTQQMVSNIVLGLVI